MPYASIWYPGWTLFIVMTLPDVEVRWLPEQVSEVHFATKAGWFVDGQPVAINNNVE